MERKPEPEERAERPREMKNRHSQERANLQGRQDREVVLAEEEVEAEAAVEGKGKGKEKGKLHVEAESNPLSETEKLDALQEKHGRERRELRERQEWEVVCATEKVESVKEKERIWRVEYARFLEKVKATRSRAEYERVASEEKEKELREWFWEEVRRKQIERERLEGKRSAKENQKVTLRGGEEGRRRDALAIKDPVASSLADAGTILYPTKEATTLGIYGTSLGVPGISIPLLLVDYTDSESDEDESDSDEGGGFLWMIAKGERGKKRL